MRIGVIGGISRQEPDLARLASRAGHSVEFHAGHVGGRGTADLRALVARCELVVIVTDQNSHGAARLAKRFVREMRCESVLVARCGVARFGAIVDAIAVRVNGCGASSYGSSS